MRKPHTNLDVSIAGYTDVHDLITYRSDNIWWAAALWALVTNLLMLVCDWLIMVIAPVITQNHDMK